MFEEKKMEMEIGGRTLKISTGKIARQAHGAVMLQYGETVLLATAVRSQEPKKGINFFPLTVDFIEKYYSSGKIPGGFFKREARPSSKATLTARMIDRPIRPLFAEGFYNDVQIVITVLSYDRVNTPDHLGITAASAALSISDIPFLGPVAGVVVGYKDGEFILNPTPEQLETSEIDLSVAGTKDAITMVEAGANEVDEATMLEAIKFGHEAIKKLVAFQEELQKIVGKVKLEVEVPELDKDITSFIDENGKERLKKAVMTHGKHERDAAVNELEEELIEKFSERYTEEEEMPEDTLKEFKNYYHDLMKELVRESMVKDHFRVDGRGLEDIRQISVETDILPMTHGSALFTRGETQALVVTTLGTKEDEQIVDGLDEETRKKFFLHYNFPQYSVGEVGFMRGPGRRELGHGTLAERALSYVMPDVDEFPYTVRVVSEITESNGSSSQASICGGSLALMDAGVPIKGAVAGIAMGLIKEGDDYVVLTDIMGLEDHLGDMDFKVAGTENGITALQMDIKITGIDEEIMRIALKQANAARKHILGKMNEVIDKPNGISKRAPRIFTMNVNPQFISDIIGPGGKNIRAIIEQTGAKVNIDDTGKVLIFSEDEEKLNETVELIKQYTFEAKPGEIYDGKVVRIAKFGAFVELAPGKDGLLHISEISHKRLKTVEEELALGDIVKVKVKEVDGTGKVSLSRKALLEEKKQS